MTDLVEKPKAGMAFGRIAAAALFWAPVALVVHSNAPKQLSNAEAGTTDIGWDLSNPGYATAVSTKPVTDETLEQIMLDPWQDITQALLLTDRLRPDIARSAPESRRKAVCASYAAYVASLSGSDRIDAVRRTVRESDPCKSIDVVKLREYAWDTLDGWQRVDKDRWAEAQTVALDVISGRYGVIETTKTDIFSTGVRVAERLLGGEAS